MTETTVFKSNRSQAVRLPKAVALPDEVQRVEVIRMGQARLIVPIGHGWDDFFDGSGVTDDFMTERDQPEMQLIAAGAPLLQWGIACRRPAPGPIGGSLAKHCGAGNPA